MKITDVTPQKNNTGRVNVFVDGKFSFSLDEAAAVLGGVKPGRELTFDELTSFLGESDYTKARDYCLGIISRKSITSAGLKAKLSEKGYDEMVIEKTIDELTELGYVDDENFCALFMEYCLEKMWGKRKIRFEMKLKGLSDELIERFLSDFCEDDIYEKMSDVILSKYRHEDLSDPKTKAKITRYFASRGFEFSSIDSAMQIALREKTDE